MGTSEKNGLWNFQRHYSDLLLNAARSKVWTFLITVIAISIIIIVFLNTKYNIIFLNFSSHLAIRHSRHTWYVLLNQWQGSVPWQLLYTLIVSKMFAKGLQNVTGREFRKSFQNNYFQEHPLQSLLLVKLLTYSLQLC